MFATGRIALGLMAIGALIMIRDRQRRSALGHVPLYDGSDHIP
jgi:hypothetical protein